ncbi:putative bifunctional diguanylate cyclase/phosphodiesterase [Ferribacterium limneticum]|uniref:putative bifunctional diguanylate cyclase/phosphodiesterase n=1 Tax=Ferribacterium limneticum TaxID=76259 RepID=UPI001CF808B5|nr:EAL domain-containing protein [Ferribacterium limneticum]UCV22811.1 EAL domain-containing protein [Ferribacterium limneticum]
MTSGHLVEHPCCPSEFAPGLAVRPPELCAIQHAIFENAGRAIVLTDPDGLIVYFNRAAQKLLGYSSDDVVNRVTPMIFHLADELISRAEALTVELQRPVAAGFDVFIARLGIKAQYDADWTLVRKDGSRLPVSLTVSALRDMQGRVQGYLGIASDISVRRKLEQDLRIAAIAFESRAAILVTDASQHILQVNAAFTELTGYSADEAIGQTPRLLKSGRQDSAFYKDMWEGLERNGHWQGEIWNRRKNGEIFPEWLTINGVRDGQGKITHYVSTFSDISNLKVAESEIHNLAFYDPLTGLPNRRLLLNRINKACAAGKRSGKYGALLIIDIDHFKTLNDTLGHDVGDYLLVEVATRLGACIREGDTAARQGGDEFVVMLEELGSDLEGAGIQAEMVAEKIRAELGMPYLLGEDAEYVRTASIGISLFLGQEKSTDVLLKQSDIALYKAKDAGRNTIRFFDNAMQTALDERAALEAGLRRALARNELLLHVQPQVDTQRRLIGAEALLRWQPPGKPMVPPGDFIPLAEETGLIVAVGLWVLDRACAGLRRWADDPRTSCLSMAVNVSARQFRQADFVLQVGDALARHGANPHLLKLELTESLLLDNVEETVAKMQALRATGVRFSLDDFGTGYASLAYLKRFPFEQLKVDRSFISDITHNPDAAAIVRAIIAMGNTLRLGVVAEGVEASVQHDYLVEHGCCQFQGYLFGKPMSFADFDAALDGLSGEVPEVCDDWVI